MTILYYTRGRIETSPAQTWKEPKRHGRAHIDSWVFSWIHIIFRKKSYTYDMYVCMRDAGCGRGSDFLSRNVSSSYAGNEPNQFHKRCLAHSISTEPSRPMPNCSSSFVQRFSSLAFEAPPIQWQTRLSSWLSTQ
jgi:hypothetical protein